MSELFISILTAAIIVGLGLLIHVVLGFLRSKAKAEESGKKIEFSCAKMVSSVIVGALTGLILVLPQIENMNWADEPVKALTFGVTLIGTVAGIDAIAKKSGQVVKASLDR